MFKLFYKQLYLSILLTASSTCRLYVLILELSASIISWSLSWIFLSSSAWKAISFNLLSAFRMFFCVSAWRRCSLSSSPSSSVTYKKKKTLFYTNFLNKKHKNIPYFYKHETLTRVLNKNITYCFSYFSNFQSIFFIFFFCNSIVGSKFNYIFLENTLWWNIRYTHSLF